MIVVIKKVNVFIITEGSTHRYSVVGEHGELIQENYSGAGRPADGDYTLKDFENYIYFGHIGTLMFKNIFLNPQHDYSIISKAHDVIGDITLCMILTCLGKVYVMENNMASYRSINRKGASNWVSQNSKINRIAERIEFLDTLEAYCLNEMQYPLKHVDRLNHYIWWSVMYMVRYPTKHNWETLRTVYRLSHNKTRVYLYVFKHLLISPLFIYKHLSRKIK